MKLMSNSIYILFLFFILFFSQKDPYYNKKGIPSTYGINTYVKNNEESLIKEYEYRVDTLYDVYIWTENLGETSNYENLGEFNLPNDVTITNEEKYVAYEFKDLSKFKQRSLNYTDRTVKAVIFHELTHAYFNKSIIQLRNKNIDISPEYSTFRIYPASEYQFGAEFIEEGVCEYIIYYLNENASLENVPIPENKTELLDKKNKINNVYYYSVLYLKDFLDKYGVKKGIKILLINKAPNYEEILNSELFFNRLKIN
jgi:hypothetical protein